MEQKQNQMIRTVLLVEDNPMVQRVLKAQLASLGYKVTTVNDATGAIQALSHHHYNLIATDLGLPDQPGEVVIQAARISSLNQLTPIIVCTAHADKAKEQECLDLGANAILIKPYSLELLKATIQRLTEN